MNIRKLSGITSLFYLKSFFNIAKIFIKKSQFFLVKHRGKGKLPDIKLGKQKIIDSSKYVLEFN